MNQVKQPKQPKALPSLKDAVSFRLLPDVYQHPSKFQKEITLNLDSKSFWWNRWAFIRGNNVVMNVIKIVWKRQHQKCNSPVILHFQDCLKWSLPNPRDRLHSGNQGLSFLEINWEKPRKWEITVWRIPVTEILRNGSLSSTEQPKCLKKNWKTGCLTFRGVGADPRQAGFPGNYLGACLLCSYKIVLKEYRWKMNWIKPRWCCLARPVSTGWSVKNICFRN